MVGAHGTASFTLKAATSSTAAGLFGEPIRVEITILGTSNTVPTADGNEFEMHQAERFNGQLTAADVDDAGPNALNYQVATPPAHGMLHLYAQDEYDSQGVLLHAAGSFSYTPDTAFHGTDTFTFVVSDGQSRSQPTTVTIEVHQATPPSFQIDTVVAAESVLEDVVLESWIKNVVFGSNHVDGAPITFEVTVDDSELFRNAGQPVIELGSDQTTYDLVFQPQAVGTTTLRVRLIDGTQVSTVQIVTLQIVQDDRTQDSGPLNWITKSFSIDSLNNGTTNSPPPALPVEAPLAFKPVSSSDPFEIDGAGSASVNAAGGLFQNHTAEERERMTVVTQTVPVTGSDANGNNIAYGSVQLHSDGSFTYIPPQPVNQSGAWSSPFVQDGQNITEKEVTFTYQVVVNGDSQERTAKLLLKPETPVIEVTLSSTVSQEGADLLAEIDFSGSPNAVYFEAVAQRENVPGANLWPVFVANAAFISRTRTGTRLTNSLQSISVLSPEQPIKVRLNGSDDVREADLEFRARDAFWGTQAVQNIESYKVENVAPVIAGPVKFEPTVEEWHEIEVTGTFRDPGAKDTFSASYYGPPIQYSANPREVGTHDARLQWTRDAHDPALIHFTATVMAGNDGLSISPLTITDDDGGSLQISIDATVFDRGLRYELRVSADYEFTTIDLFISDKSQDDLQVEFFRMEDERWIGDSTSTDVYSLLSPDNTIDIRYKEAGRDWTYETLEIPDMPSFTINNSMSIVIGTDQEFLHDGRYAAEHDTNGRMFYDVVDGMLEIGFYDLTGSTQVYIEPFDVYFSGTVSQLLPGIAGAFIKSGDPSIICIPVAGLDLNQGTQIEYTIDGTDQVGVVQINFVKPDGSSVVPPTPIKNPGAVISIQATLEKDVLGPTFILTRDNFEDFVGEPLSNPNTKDLTVHYEYWSSFNEIHRTGSVTFESDLKSQAFGPISYGYHVDPYYSYTDSDACIYFFKLTGVDDTDDFGSPSKWDNKVAEQDQASVEQTTDHYLDSSTAQFAIQQSQDSSKNIESATTVDAGDVVVSVKEGTVALDFETSAVRFAPRYVGDDSVHPIATVELALPLNAKPESIKAKLIILGDGDRAVIEGDDVEFDVVPLSDWTWSDGKPLRYVVPLIGTGKNLEDLPTGVYDYRVQFTVVDDEEKTRTLNYRDSFAWQNRSSAEAGRMEFGRGWDVAEASRLVYSAETRTVLLANGDGSSEILDLIYDGCAFNAKLLLNDVNERAIDDASPPAEEEDLGGDMPVGGIDLDNPLQVGHADDEFHWQADRLSQNLVYEIEVDWSTFMRSHFENRALMSLVKPPSNLPMPPPFHRLTGSGSVINTDAPLCRMNLLITPQIQQAMLTDDRPTGM